MTSATSLPARLFTFVGGVEGPWLVESMQCVTGEPMLGATRLSVATGVVERSEGMSWLLRGITSNERYVVRTEKSVLVSKQEGLGRPDSTRAALIPIRKSAAWWAMSQDERRHIFEEQSKHVALGLKVLPAVARRLHHCRDLGPDEPFDFLTWFEYSAAHSAEFEELVQVLRASPEWEYVERETDIRLRAGV